MIFKIMSVIPAVGGTSIYFSSRRKKFSIRSKTLTSISWLPETALTVLENGLSEWSKKQNQEDTH